MVVVHKNLWFEASEGFSENLLLFKISMDFLSSFKYLHFPHKDSNEKNFN